VPFDARRLTASGTPTPVLQDINSSAVAGGDFAFAQNGTFVYLARKDRWPISWLDRGGKSQPLYGPPGIYADPRFSPDGKRLAFSIAAGHELQDIWVKDLDRDTPSRLSFLPGENVFAVWTPDGKNIVFKSTNQAAPGLYWIRSDGSGEAQRLTDGKLDELPYSFSSDGKRLAFSATGMGGIQHDIFTSTVEGGTAQGSSGIRLGKPELFLGTLAGEFFPAFSPDGRWLAYESNEGGSLQVYVRPFPGPGGRWLIGLGMFPLWSRDGHDLLFETEDGRVMAVSYTAHGDSFAPGNPREW